MGSRMRAVTSQPLSTIESCTLSGTRDEYNPKASVGARGEKVAAGLASHWLCITVCGLSISGFSGLGNGANHSSYDRVEISSISRSCSRGGSRPKYLGGG